MKTAVIISRVNGVGLDRDIELLASALENLGIGTTHFRPTHVGQAFLKNRRADFHLHLERIYPLWSCLSGTHVLIPNQERYPRRLINRLKKVDTVLCKSRHACGIFSKLHPDARHIGFTSEDRLLGEVEKDYGSFLHLAGRSTLKNTECLLDLWGRHPDWPVLTLVQHPSNAPKSVPDNVRRIARHVSDSELCLMQNRHGIHLCPSLSEGWGHYIVEAMSCRAVVVVTDAPPMNELVEPARGIAVPYSRTEPRHLGTNYFVNPSLLEQAIERLLRMPDPRRRELGEAARQWFESNHRAFLRSLPQVFCRSEPQSGTPRRCSC